MRSGRSLLGLGKLGQLVQRPAHICSSMPASWPSARRPTHQPEDLSPPGLGDDLDSVHGRGLRVEEAIPGKLLARPLHRRATRILFDHTGFPVIDEMFRIVTLGWAQMLPRLQRHTKTAEPAPCFEF